MSRETPEEISNRLATFGDEDAGLFAIACGLFAIASAVRALGTNDAATRMGAIELLAKETSDGCGAIAGALGEAAEALRTIAEQMPMSTTGTT